MQVSLNLCVSCERSPDKLVELELAPNEDEALEWVLHQGQRKLLCMECRLKYFPSATTDLDKLLEGPIDFPPGVTVVEHTCPQLEYEGKSEAEATLELKMERDGAYYHTTCPYCNVSVRSLSTDDE